MDVLGVVREEATESEDTTGTGTGTETPPAEPANDKGADDPPAISAATEEQLREATARAEATLAMTQRLLADA